MRAFCVAVIVLVAILDVYLGFFARQPIGRWGFPVPNYVASDSRFLPVESVQPGSPLAKAGIVRGDRLRALVDHALPLYFPGPQTHMTFEVNHGSSRRVVALTAPRFFVTRYPVVEIIFFSLEMLWLVLATLLVWRRWEDDKARLLALYFILFAFTLPGWASAIPWPAYGLYLSIYALFVFAQYATLVRFAATYPAAASNAARRFVAVYGVWLTIGLGLLNAISILSWLWLNVSFTNSTVYRYASLLCADVLPAIGLTLGFLGSSGIERKRAGALLAFFLASITGPVAYNLILASSLRVSYELRPLLATLAIQGLGFVYVMFRQRMFDVTFVLNRAAVYAVLSSVLVVLFIAAEWLVEHAFASTNRTENAFVQLGIALLLIFAVRTLHGHVERFVDRTMFRQRHENEQALLQAAHDIRFMSDAAAIANRAVQVAARHTDAAWVALYEFDGASYNVAAQSGAIVAPQTISQDDPAVVALRATGQPTENVTASIWEGAFLIPLVARARIDGFLACGPKQSGEVYAADERDALSALTLSVVVALDGARLAALEAEIARLRGFVGRPALGILPAT